MKIWFRALRARSRSNRGLSGPGLCGRSKNGVGTCYGKDGSPESAGLAGLANLGSHCRRRGSRRRRRWWPHGPPRNGEQRITQTASLSSEKQSRKREGQHAIWSELRSAGVTRN